MPVDMKRYPKNWKSEIVPRILRRAGGNEQDPRINARCERCGVRNYDLKNKLTGTIESSHDSIKSAKQRKRHLESLPLGQKFTVIVLTTAHIGAPHDDGTPGDKHDKMDVRDCNLLSLCQRCHLKEDMGDHVANRKRSNMRRKMDAGNKPLFPALLEQQR